MNLNAWNYEDGLTEEQLLGEEKRVDPFYTVADPYTQKIVHAIFRIGFTYGFNTCLEDVHTELEEEYDRGYDAGMKVDPRWIEEEV